MPCTRCLLDAKREYTTGRPPAAHFHGNPDGYHKPSPQRRFSTKLAAQTGNANSMG